MTNTVTLPQSVFKRLEKNRLDYVADGVVLDFAADGSLVGIDVQHASLKADIQSLSLSHLPLHELQAA